MDLYQWLNTFIVQGYPLGYSLVCMGIHSAFSASAFLSTWYLSRTIFYSQRGNGMLLGLSSLALSACAALLAHYIPDMWGAF